MSSDFINIYKISKPVTKKPKNGMLYVCWMQDGIEGLEIDGKFHENVSNSISFINLNHDWKIFRSNKEQKSGYVMSMNPEVLNNPVLSKLHINELRLFNLDDIPLINLSPGIAKRTEAILEMIDELLGSELNHKNEAILSLLNTFFVYCDGQCNIKSKISDSRSKNTIVYKFKKLVDKFCCEYHEVADYAQLLSITPKYLNECVKEVLGYTAKGIIAEQLLMRSRHKLKFSNQSIKEISYDLGFSSPDYFSSFFKNHTGTTPSSLRKY
ncbi:Helix-turn-helix domain-containing protein [Hyunsoonleella jejuensis]|uniref:Helix-turn-helix domain-containing protein n=1 Tax=Hyunsoonleella jejuensis TaxID=419940 RepID=A0A1H9JJV6_9FLAO|nr:helix-turn-helix domain-containing protein [Hyunsoonleella jejuensis]SEQ87184.1 Helix-turn-helix domain-containing protein [Hyunsoonleella jejuensis]